MVWPNLIDGNVLTTDHISNVGVEGEIRLEKCTANEFAHHLKDIDESWLELRLLEANNDFLDRKNNEAQKGYELIKTVLELKGLNDTSIYRVCLSSLEKISLAQNFFGYSINYVPLIDRKILSRRAEASVEVANSVYLKILRARKMMLQESILNELRNSTRLSVSFMVTENQREIEKQELRIQSFLSEISSEIERKSYIDAEIEEIWGDRDRLMNLESGDTFDFFDFITGAATAYMGGTKLFAAAKAADTVFSLKFIDANKSHLKSIADGVGSSGILSLLGGSKQKVYSELDLFPLDQAIRELTLESFEAAQQIASARFSIQEAEADILFRRSTLDTLTQVVTRMDEEDLLNITEPKAIEFLRAAEFVLEHAVKEAQHFLYLYARAHTFWSHEDREHLIDYTVKDPDQLLLEVERLRNQEVLIYEDTIGQYQRDLQPMVVKIKKTGGRKIADILKETNRLKVVLPRRLVPTNEYDHRITKIALKAPGIESLQGSAGIYIGRGTDTTIFLEGNKTVQYRHGTPRFYHKYDTGTWERQNAEIDTQYASSLPMHDIWEIEFETGFWENADFSAVEYLEFKLSLAYRT